MKWELGVGVSRRWARGRHSPPLRVLSLMPRGGSTEWYSLNGPLPWAKWSGVLLFLRCSLGLQLPTSMEIRRF